ncbi:MAG: MarR family winged helix-turn-helix transcriptional regulator [Thermoplasmata archaeon]
MVATALLAPHEPVRSAPEQLVNVVHAMMKSVVHRLQPSLESEGISTGQFWALHVVSSLQSASLSTVARHLSVSTPTVCANVDQLEAAGLVSRHRSERDHRAVVLALTPKGRKVEARVWARIGRLLNEAAAGLPAADISTTVRVFEELQRRLDPATDGTGRSS